MPSKEEFVQQAAQILSDDGFEMVDASSGDHIAAIRDRETSVLMQVFAKTMDDGEPVVLISSLAVSNFKAPAPEDLLKLLLVLNGMNSNQYFGTWYFEPDPPVVVLDHSLFVNHMSPEEFATMVRVIEGTADFFDDELSEFLDGDTAKDTLIKHAERLPRSQI